MDHKTVLTDAASLLEDRGVAYGGVEESFTRAAQLASLKLNILVTPYQVAIIMESVKDARRAVNPTHYDSHVDGVNYRAFAAEFAMRGAARIRANIEAREREDAVQAVRDHLMNGGGDQDYETDRKTTAEDHRG